MKQVLIYNDEGVSPECLEETVNLFKRLNYPYFIASSLIVNNEKWEENTFLLVMPGGRASPYHKALYPDGFKKILHYISDGGKYLGICAGGYYGASQIIFEKGHSEYEIITKQALGLYPGIAEGPAFGLGLFRYDSEEGACTAMVTAENITFPTYFNGGCWFHSQEEHNSAVQIIARYTDIDTQPAAIILSEYGKGRVCLSGVHFEYALMDDKQRERDQFIGKLFDCLIR